MIITKDKKINEKLYLISLALTIVMYMLNFSMGLPIPYYKYLLYGLRFSAYILLLIKLFNDLIFKKFSIKEIVLYGVIGLFLLLIVYQSRVYGHFIYYVYIIGSKNVDYKSIIKVALLSHVITALFIVLLTVIGIIPDVIFLKGSRDRHGLGFNWCTHLPNMYLYMVLYYIYVRQDKMKIFEYIILIACNVLLYIYTDTRSAFALTILAIVCAFIISKIKFFNKYYKIYDFVPYIIIIFLPAMIIFLTLMYSEDSVILTKLNSILNGRLSLGKSALETYGVGFLAKNITFVGGEPADGVTYNFVDSSFVKYLINFGIINFGLIIALLICFAKKVVKNKDVYLLLCFTVLMVHSTFDPQLLYIEFNDFFLCLWL